jgi:sodium transport system permease protein
MNPRNIAVVYRKEFRDLLRDRRTIISMIVVPVVVIPLLMLLFGGLAARLVSKAAGEVAPVMILGETNAPGIAARLREIPRLRVVPTAADYTNQISEKKIRAAVEIPTGFMAALTSDAPKTVRIYHYEGEIKSQFGADALRDFFNNLRESTVSNRLAARNLSPDLLRPFTVEKTNVAPPKKVGGNLIGGIIPYIIILMSLTGAMYSAIDLTAGEKERGTIETLLCSPAGRTEIVLGKFLMVLTVSSATTLLSLSSMGGSFFAATRLVGRMAGAGARLPLVVDAPGLLLVFLMMVPIAVMFAALLIALALFARSSKEAQSYISPLMIVVIIPAVSAMLPGVELDSALSLVPVLNVSLVSKEILSGTLNGGHMALIFLSSSVYAGLALAFAVWQFQRESVLFRT